MGSKDANLAIFDFNLRYALRDLCNDGSGGFDMWNLNNTGLVFGGGLSGYDVVTFVENHDVDRIGWQVVDCGDPHEQQVGSTCLKLYTDGTHDPIYSDKEDMGYPYIMAAEGRPTVFWKDMFWYGLDDDIQWQMAMRQATATGGSAPIQSLNPFFTSGNGGDLFVLNRYGTSGGVTDGMVLALNDNPSAEASVWVNTPFSNKYLKDYSDGYLFVTTQAYADTRANVKAQSRDYAWWSVTGLYPQSPGTAAAHFNMDATPGGAPHFIALRLADAPNMWVNGAPIAVGDEVAVKNSNGDVVGIGRIGQGTQWDGVHDMLIEVLGAPSANGMGNGEQFTFVVYDASASSEVTIGYVQYATVGNTFSFSADRPGSPNRNGNFSTFNVTTTRQGLYAGEGISQVLAFDPPVPLVPLVALCGAASQADAGVYNDGLQAGDNDGAGFGAWTNLNPVPNNGNAGFFVATSTVNGNGDSNNDGDINTGGEAWGFYANNGNLAEATRPFTIPMTPGSSLFLKMDNGWLDDVNANGVVGISLRNASNQDLMEFYFSEGSSNYTINDASNTDSGIPFTDEGLEIEILMLSSTTYELRVTRLEGPTSYTFSNRTFSNSGSPDRIRFFNFSAGNGDFIDGVSERRNTYFNSLQLCNPPALVINEIDYDQPTSDDQEFIELRNMNTVAIDLDPFILQLVDGTGSVYDNIDLPAVSLAPGDYYVICRSGSSVPNCDLTYFSSVDQIQDGAPDAVRLQWNGVTVDAMSYEGDVPGAVEGSGTGLADNSTATGAGLSRAPNGVDTDQNNVDFELACITPGEANTSDNTDTDADGAPDGCDTCPLAQNEDAIANFNTSTCACNTGYYAVTTTVNGQEVITGCQLCPVGSFCPDGINAYLCPAGEYQDQPGQTQCNACSPGYFSGAEGSISCTECPAGKFNPVFGATACQNCVPGTFQSNAGAVECINCPPGKFNPVYGAIACQNCDPGFYQANSGATQCDACPPGTHGEFAGQAHCETCEPGTEAPFAGQVLCQNCIPPSFSACPTVAAVNNTPGQCDASVTVPKPSLDPGCTRNHALDFDGVDDYVSASPDPSLDLTGDVSFEAWVYVKGPNSYGSFQSIIDKTETADLANYRFYLTPMNKMGFFNGATVAISTSAVPYGQWVHLAWVLESGMMTFYQNGVQDGTVAISLGAVNNGPLSIGRDNTQTNPDERYINMVLDEVRLWNIPRSQADILAAMNLEINPTYPGLVAFYNFNEGISCCDNTGLTTLPDGMGAHDGTLNNFALTSGCASNWVPGAPALGDPLTLENDFNTSCDASGAYPVGTTTVTWTATGADGDVAICTQTVTVEDAEDPSIACPADVTQNTDRGGAAVRNVLAAPGGGGRPGGVCDQGGATSAQSDSWNNIGIEGTCKMPDRALRQAPTELQAPTAAGAGSGPTGLGGEGGGGRLPSKQRLHGGRPWHLRRYGPTTPSSQTTKLKPS
ncbi:MAG: lamin tail domain-containing protein [Saprospirales bacterium]|nr:lamin tail domain-containing protein [Saprospirales bacterium]